MKKVNFISIPFKLEVHQGLSQADGLAKFSSAGIVLEFETKILGLVTTGVKEARLPLEEILSVNFKKGFFRFGAKIEIRMQSFLKLSEVPNNDGKIVLRIPRDQFEPAKEAVAVLEKYLNEYTEMLPPPQTPVRSLFGDSEFDTNKLNEPE